MFDFYKVNTAKKGAASAKLRAIRDRDHKEIHRLHQALQTAIIGGTGMAKIVKSSQELIQATLLHFESEERAMDEDQLASLLRHQELHAEMIETLEDISKDLEKRSIGGAMQLIKFFEGRIAHHLKVEDVEFEQELGN